MSHPKTRQLGTVNLVQIQPHGLIIDAPESSPVRYLYDPTRRVEVQSLDITPRGIEATLPSGEHVLDIHHLDHPGKEYDDDDLISVGFTAHYDAMRSEFGSHMVNGIAGENIIIDHQALLWSEDLGKGLAIENQDTKEMAKMNLVSFAEPCVEFSQFCAQRQHEKMPGHQLGEILRFLGEGRRGFLLVLDESLDVITVRPGDRVFQLGK